jgi:hypothetical protein
LLINGATYASASALVLVGVVVVVLARTYIHQCSDSSYYHGRSIESWMGTGRNL